MVIAWQTDGTCQDLHEDSNPIFVDKNGTD
jgi:hypothetical protein